MNLDLFFEKFDLFADAPGAVAKMRELVLDWATTGKLCHSESAKWTKGVLGDVIELISGQHLLAHEHNEDRRGIPYLTGPSDFGEKSPIPTRWTDQPKVTAEPGDILITVKGSGVGKTNVLVEQPTAISRQLMAIRVTGADPEFVHVVLKRAAEHFQNAKTGIAIPGIGRSEVLTLNVVLPPLAEQKRIVAKVDELMALCDRLEEQQQERETRHAALARASLARFAAAPTPANLQFLFHPSYDIAPADLRKSILTLAVQGKLVPQDPNDEPADQILHRVANLRAKSSPIKQAKAAKRIREFDATRCDFDIPDSWTWCRLGDIVLDFRYGSSRKCHRNGDGVPVLRIPNIQNGRIDATDLKFTDMPTSEFNELRLQEGDLLLVRSNGSENLVGRSAVACVGAERFAYAGYLVRARIPRDFIFSRFLHAALSTAAIRDQIEGPIRTTSGVKNINTTELSNLVLPLPPVAEQRRIAAKVDQLMALVDELETQVAASRGAAADLLSALVAEVNSVKARKVTSRVQPLR